MNNSWNKHQKNVSFLTELVIMIVLKKYMVLNLINNINVIGIAIIKIMIKNVFNNVN